MSAVKWWEDWEQRQARPGFVRKSRPWAQRQPREARPFPVAPLARRLGLGPSDSTALADRLGIGRRWVRRYRDIGLTLRQADEWAARAGVHPAEVWAIWDDLDRLRGAALRNAAKETCVCGEPFDRVNNRGERFHSVCHAERVRRYKKSVKALLTANITQQEAS